MKDTDGLYSTRWRLFCTRLFILRSDNTDL